MAVDWYGDDFKAAIRKAAFRGVVAGTAAVVAEGNRLIRSPPKSGNVYRRRGVSHQASAPGEAPATDTGRLIQSARTENNEAALSGVAIWSTAYSRRLELGFIGVDAAGRTYNQGPRPYARPALANSEQTIVELIVNEIRKEL